VPSPLARRALRRLARTPARDGSPTKTERRQAARAWARGGRILPKIGDPQAGNEARYVAELRQWTRVAAAPIRAWAEAKLRGYELRQDARKPPKDPTAIAKRQSRRIEKHGRAAANLQLSGVTPGDLWRGQTDRTRAAMDEFVTRNVALIRSIPVQLQSQVEETIREGMAEGMHVKALRRAVAERFKVAESRAELIARDQTLKLAAQLTQVRSQEAGIKGYTWRVSGGPRGDGRVRPMHLELEGTHQTWDNPPETNEDGDQNHPGEDYQCRCTAEPDVDDLLEALLA
jgi:SPP1 gp7 family putative phage head morphogenesis protein